MSLCTNSLLSWLPELNAVLGSTAVGYSIGMSSAQKSAHHGLFADCVVLLTVEINFSFYRKCQSCTNESMIFDWVSDHKGSFHHTFCQCSNRIRKCLDLDLTVTMLVV